MLADVVRDDMPFDRDPVAAGKAGGGMLPRAGDSAGRAIRGILVGVADGRFRGDSRSEDVELGWRRAGELAIGGMGCKVDPLRLDCAEDPWLSVEGLARSV